MSPQNAAVVHSNSKSYDLDEEGDKPYQPAYRQRGASLVSHDSTYLVDAFTGCDDELSFLQSHHLTERASDGSSKATPCCGGQCRSAKDHLLLVEFLKTVPNEPLSLAQRALIERRAQQQAIENDNIVAAPASGVRTKLGPPSASELNREMNWGKPRLVSAQ